MNVAKWIGRAGRIPPAIKSEPRSLRHMSSQIPPRATNEAVTRIINAGPTSHPKSESTRHILNCLVHNSRGVLSHISGILAGRGFNIDSLIVAKTNVPDLSRVNLVVRGDARAVEQARRLLEDLVPVYAVLEYTHSKVVERELLLVKMSTTTLDTKDRYQTDDEYLPSDGESNAQSGLVSAHLKRQAITDLARLFGARVVDVTMDKMILELSAKSSRVDAFLKVLEPYGILEAARSGIMAMPRSPVDGLHEKSTEAADDDSDTVDATMLPPG
ncbi:hypothetical protein HK104_002897 [Borealophlyctis nickersoniae]|nr:hypothetical protein HK104_002897 [Borealophlyctis nickersoniae]